MKTLLILILVVNYLSVFSQTKFSDTQFEKKRIEIENYTIINLDSALYEANSLLNYSLKTKSLTKIAKSQSTLAYVKIMATFSDEARELNKKSLLINLKLKDYKEVAKNYYNEASIYSRNSDFVKSIDLLQKSIELAKKEKSYLLLQKNYRALANIYCDQRNYNIALKYALEALKYSNDNNSTTENSYLNATIAEIYRLKGDLTTSNKIFKKAYDSFVKSRDSHGQAYVLTNWSLCYENDYGKLLKMELDAQEIWDNIAPENLMSVTNLGNIAYSYFDIAKSDSLQKTIKDSKIKKTKYEALSLAEIYYSRCLKIAKKKKNLDSVLYYSQSLSELQEYIGDYQNALSNLKLRNKINDSLYSQKNKNKIAKLESDKEIQIKNNQLKLNKINIENKEKQKYYFIGGLILLGIIGCLLYYQSRSRKKVNEKLSFLNNELDASNKAKTRFFSILNHDLRRPVANLVFFLQLQKESPELLDAESTKRMQDKTMAGAENLLTAMEDILQWSKSQMENFKPQPKQIYINDLFDDIKNHFSSEENIKISFENADNIMINTDENYLKTVIRNLTSNAIKALAGIENPEIILTAFSENNNKYLSISDNGKGASQEQFKALYDENEVVGIKSGLGLHLIRDLAKAIDCEVGVKSKVGVGTTFLLKFK